MNESQFIAELEALSLKCPIAHAAMHQYYNSGGVINPYSIAIYALKSRLEMVEECTRFMMQSVNRPFIEQPRNPQ